MSLVHLSNVCSHLQNSSKARLALTSLPSTNQILRLCLSLQSSGFLSLVTRSGPRPPTQLLTPTSLPHASDPALLDPTHPDTAHVTRSNIASRRLWVGLKYWKEEPVIRKMRMESKPTRQVWVGSQDLERIVRGREANYVKGLTKLGECLYISTHKGVMESREAAEKKLGGLVLCRVV